MGRFESPGQVVGLFVAASIVSVGLIFLINAEQQSRLQAQRQHQHSSEALVQQHERDLEASGESLSASPSPESDTTPINNNLWNLLHYFQDGLRKLSQAFHFRHEAAPVSSRRKRRATINHNGDLHVFDGDASAEPGSFKNVPPAPEFHKIRHAMHRLGGGGLDGDAVLRMILDSKHIPPEAPPHRQHYETREKPKSKESGEGHLQRFERNFPLIIEKLEESKSQPTPVAITAPSVENIPDLNSSANASSKVTKVPPQSSPNNSSAAIVMQNLDICYKTDDVLLVILVTCCLNFAFVMLIWASVKWLSSSKERRFQHLTCDGEDGSRASDGPVSDEIFWSNCGLGEFRNVKSAKNCMASRSLYSFRPDQIPRRIFRRSRSYSMEDLRYTQT